MPLGVYCNLQVFSNLSTLEFSTSFNWDILILDAHIVLFVCLFLIHLSSLLMTSLETSFLYHKIANPFLDYLQDSLFISVCFILSITHVTTGHIIYLYFVLLLSGLHLKTSFKSSILLLFTTI